MLVSAISGGEEADVEESGSKAVVNVKVYWLRGCSALSYAALWMKGREVLQHSLDSQGDQFKVEMRKTTSWHATILCAQGLDL